MNNVEHKNIAIFLPGLYGGGAERILINLGEGLVHKGFKVDFVISQLEGSFVDQIPQFINIIPLNKTKRNHFRTLSSIPMLIQYLKVKKPETLLTALHGNLIAIWAKWLAKSSTQLVITEHNTFSIQNKSLPRGIRWLNAFLVHTFYPLANEIVAVSQGVADDLSTSVAIDINRIKVIYNPIVNSELRIKANVPLTHPWFNDNCPPVIIAIGRLTEQKDFSCLIRAFYNVRKVRNARLLILGEGEDREKLSKLSFELDLQKDIQMPGFLSNPYNFLANSKLFVLSSKWEGLPTVLVEAMACRVPVISTDCPSGPHEILKNGEYGKIIPVGNVEALTTAIIDVLDGNYSIPPDKSWENFTVEKTIEKYMEIFLEHS
jgi:glycosyltransferase involved in cell wall biosynthesis